MSLTPLKIIICAAAGTGDKDKVRERLAPIFNGNRIDVDMSLAQSGVEVSELARDAARGPYKVFDSLRSQIVTSKGRGGRRHLPYAFTEHGVIMAANVLNSERAVQVSVHVVRAFVQLRQMQLTSSDLRDKLDALERKYDDQFKVVFMAIRQLMTPSPTKPRQIGFRSKTAKK